MVHWKFKKLSAFALVLALLFTLVNPAALADDSGTCGEGVTWSVSGGKLTISGQGKMKDFITWDAPTYNDAQPWYGRTDITSLEIGPGVTHIGLNAFRAMKGLTTVTIPDTVEDMGFACFADCANLQEVTVNAKRVGESSFIRCYALHTVNIGPNVTDMGISCYENCTGLQKVCITDLAAWCRIAFGGLLANPLEKALHLYLNGAEVTDLTVPAGITKINDYAFINAMSITSVTLPEGLTEIGEYAFYSCRGIKTLNLPANSLTKIGSYAFESCTALNTLATFPASVQYYGAYSFRFIPLPEYTTIPSGYIGRCAFESCGTIADLTFGENVSYIGEDAFKGLPLRHVTYGGSRAQWDAIPKEEKGNEKLLSLEPECKGSGSQSGTIYTGKSQVTFGKYDGNDITWLVLDTDGDKTLLLSRDILEFLNYDNHSQDIPWQNSGVRAWLNRTFLGTFTAEQQAQIVETKVPVSNNARYGTSTGPETTDKIFLLSEAEVRKYFPIEETAAAKCTSGAYARSNKDSAISDPNGNNSFGNTSYWWLRTRGMFPYQVAYVDYVGYVHGEGMTMNNNIAGARPAMWVSTSALYGGVYDFVSRCYKLILGRDGDAEGLKGWCDALLKKTAAAANIIDGFVKSDEYTNRHLSDAESVDILYRTMLNREADEGGKAGWVDALSKGYTLQHIINGFCGSAEFSALCKDYGIEPGTVEAPAPVNANTPRGKIEAFVKRCYQLILNRGADEGGLKGWSDALEGKIAAAAQIINGFVCSPEYINRNLTSEQSVTILYKTMLDRDPDEGGKAGWVDALSKGYTLQHIINGFCGSAEFTKICSDYGIEAGSVDVPAKASAALEAAAQLEAKKLPDERIGNAVSADDAGITVVNGYEPAEVEAFVKHAYRAALGREADEAGLAGWTEQIVSGAVAPKAFLRTLLGSDEFAARNLSSEAVVETLYRLYLNRGMDDAAADRVAQLAAGGLDEVIKGFEGSAEFRLVLNSFGL